jgi:exodeoxyribonuclease VIII
MKLGSLTHCAVLEPDQLAARYGIAPDRRTNAGKAVAAEMEASGIEAVTSTDMEQALAMAASVRSHQAAAALLRDGKAEQSFWWDDKLTGLRCKCRPDWYVGTTIVDLKTTIDASPKSFAASVARWRYAIQQSHYLAGTFAERFVFIAVEKTYPYAVGVYELDETAALHGSTERRSNLQTIADCRAISEWPGYGNTIQPLSLPNWALNGTTTITSDDF